MVMELKKIIQKLLNIIDYSDALFKLGKIFMKGKFVKQDYSLSQQYFKLAFFNNNPDGLYHLGHFYLDGDIFEVDLCKAIQYFNESINFNNKKKVRILNNADKSCAMKTFYNNYCYHSYNELGLIYITEYQDIKKGIEYIKEAAFAEYPFGQNNLGLLYEFFYNNEENTEYFYKQSSEHQFSLAQFNLGHLKEKKRETEESIKFYELASENEDSPLIFHFRKHHDKRLERSKTFIICLTNLKLTEFYFGEKNFEKSRNFFIKSFSKLNKSTKDTKYQFKLKATNFDDIFTYLKYYILCFPLFNLANQMNINSALKNLIYSEESKFYSQEEKNGTNNLTSSNLLEDYNQSIDYIKHNKYFEKYKSSKEDEDEIECLINEKDEINSGDEIYFDNLGDLFDFIIKSENSQKFIININKIIKMMESIIYTPPYNILFGRIRIDKPNSAKKEYPYRKDINELFYEGFGIEI